MPVKKSDSGQPNFTDHWHRDRLLAGSFTSTSANRRGQASTWDRRLKVPLAAITWSMVERAIHESKLLQARLQAKLKMAVLAVQTVQPINGWKIASHQ